MHRLPDHTAVAPFFAGRQRLALRSESGEPRPAGALPLHSSARCPDCEAAIQSFHEASLEIRELDDLNPIVARVREVKARLGDCLFEADVLRALVAYNIAAADRFRELFEIAQARD